LASCADSAVRVVSSASGHVTTTALLPMGQQIISTAYFALEGRPPSFQARILWQKPCRAFPIDSLFATNHESLHCGSPFELYHFSCLW